MNSRFPARKPGTGSFTLIEVSLGMAILILIFGVIFQLVQYSVLGAEAAGQISIRNREISGLMALVRQACLDLSPKSQLGLVPREGKGYDLVLSNAPGLILPPDYRGVRVAEFQMRKNQAGGMDLWLAESTLKPDKQRALVPDGLPNRFILLRDVRSLEWRALDTRNQGPNAEKTEWYESNKPAALKLKITRREGKRVRTDEGWFWIPTGLGPNGQLPKDPLSIGIAGPTNPATGTNPASPTNSMSFTSPAVGVPSP
jgi:hypothetical protein